MITYEQTIAVTQDPKFIVALAIVYILPLFIYFLWGSLSNARTSDGRKLSSKVIENANFWIGLMIFGFFQLALYILIIFPIWLKFFE